MSAMAVVKHGDGLWRWGSDHPAWRDGASWDALVWSTYFEGPDATVVIDPLAPTDADERERFWRALDRDVERRGLPVAILVTCAWHARSSAEVQRRYDGTIWAPDAHAIRAHEPAKVARDGASPVVGVTVADTGAPQPNREVAYRLGTDVLVVGDFLHLDGERLEVAPAAASAQTPETQRWFEQNAVDVARQLLSPTPSVVFASHGGVATAAQVAELMRRLGQP